MATTETTEILNRGSQKRWMVTVTLLMLLMVTTAIAASLWWDQRKSSGGPALKRVVYLTSTPAFAGSSSTDDKVRPPAEPPEIDPPPAYTPPRKATPTPAESTPKPTPSQQVPLLPSSALSRTRVADQRTPQNPAPKEILTPVTIMYKHRGGDSTLQVWLDGVRVWSQHLKAAEGKKQKLLGYESRAIVPIPTGEHALEVRLTDPTRGINASDTIHSRYTNGRKRSMRINLDAGDNVIQLRWKE